MLIWLIKEREARIISIFSRNSNNVEFNINMINPSIPPKQQKEHNIQTVMM